MGYATLLVEVAEGVATVTINRPEVHNAIDGQVQRDLYRALAELREDDDVGAVVFTGAAAVRSLRVPTSPRYGSTRCTPGSPRRCSGSSTRSKRSTSPRSQRSTGTRSAADASDGVRHPVRLRQRDVRAPGGGPLGVAGGRRYAAPGATGRSRTRDRTRPDRTQGRCRTGGADRAGHLRDRARRTAGAREANGSGDPRQGAAGGAPGQTRHPVRDGLRPARPAWWSSGSRSRCSTAVRTRRKVPRPS